VDLEGGGVEKVEEGRIESAFQEGCPDEAGDPCLVGPCREPDEGDCHPVKRCLSGASFPEFENAFEEFKPKPHRASFVFVGPKEALYAVRLWLYILFWVIPERILFLDPIRWFEYRYVNRVKEGKGNGGAGDTNVRFAEFLERKWIA